MKRVFIILGFAVAHAAVAACVFAAAFARGMSIKYPGRSWTSYELFLRHTADILLFPFWFVVIHAQLDSRIAILLVFVASSLVWGASLYGLWLLVYRLSARESRAPSAA